jgi:hypothetical protein
MSGSLLRDSAAACTVSLVLLTVQGQAGAADDDDTPPVRPKTVSPARWSVGLNPLALGIGRYGGDGEYLAHPYIALVANVHGDYASQAPVVNYGSPIYGFGGEAGVRFYATPDLFGFFFGVSAIAGWYDVQYYGEHLALPDVGFAIDVGGKVRLGDGGMFLALGAGVQDLWTTRYPKDIGSGISFVLGAGVDPRVLLTIGTVIR